MYCCQGNCGCGSSCKCGNGCGGCKMYADLSNSEFSDAATGTLVLGVAPQKIYFDESGGGMAGGCNCKWGSNCTCTNCGCK